MKLVWLAIKAAIFRGENERFVLLLHLGMQQEMSAREAKEHGDWFLSLADWKKRKWVK